MKKNSVPRFVSRTFFKGLAIVIPVIGAVYVLVWIARDSEAAIKSLLLTVIPEAWYIPGMGIAIFATGTFFIGLLMYPWITRGIIHGADTVFRRIPLFSSIYSPLRDLFDIFG